MFVSDPINSPTEISGLFSGVLDFVVNKCDLDLTIELHERIADGHHFYLSHHLGRASYAKDRGRRELLQPGNRCRYRDPDTRRMAGRQPRGDSGLALSAPH